MSRIRPPVKWYGGKYYMIQTILKEFPPHQTYVEPFGGGASVLLNKSPSPVEVYNDLDRRLYNLFLVLRDAPMKFLRAITLTPYHEQEFLDVQTPRTDISPPDVEAARRDYALWRLSFSGKGDSWSHTLHRSHRGMADVVSGYLSSIDEQLPLIVDRLRQVQMTCRPFERVIEKWDSIDTLFYCDPPYLPATRVPGSRKVYREEMTVEDHLRLRETLTSCRGKVILSGYPSVEYRRFYKGWSTITKDVPCQASKGKTKTRRTETLWLNF